MTAAKTVVSNEAETGDKGRRKFSEMMFSEIVSCNRTAGKAAFKGVTFIGAVPGAVTPMNTSLP